MNPQLSRNLAMTNSYVYHLYNIAIPLHASLVSLDSCANQFRIKVIVC